MERGLRDREGRTEAQREGREPETRTRRETHRDRKKVEREKQKQSTGCQVSPQHTLTLAHTHSYVVKALLLRTQGPEFYSCLCS